MFVRIEGRQTDTSDKTGPTAGDKDGRRAGNGTGQCSFPATSSSGQIGRLHTRLEGQQ